MVSGSPDVSNSFASTYSKSGLWCPALCMSPIHLFAFIAIHLSAVVTGESGFPHVSNSIVSLYSNSFVSQSGWWRPALRMSPIDLSPLIAILLSPSLPGGVQLSGYLQVIRLP